MQFERFYSVDLDKPQWIIDLGHLLYTGDNDSVRLGAELTKSGVAQTVSGTVKGLVLMPNDTALPEFNGSSSGNKVWVDLPENAFALEGRVQVAIRIIDGTTKTVVLAACAKVCRTSSTTEYDPDGEIPTWDEIEAKIDAIDGALEAASDIVSYAAQSGYSDNQKAQARVNIGAIGADDLKNVDGVTVGEFRRGYAITTNGATVDITTLTPSTTGYACAVMDCSPGDVFMITGKGGSSPRLWCFITSTGAAIDPRAAASATATNAIITAPATAAKLVVNSNFTNTPESFVVKGLPVTKQLADIQTAIGDVRNATNAIEFVHGYGIATNGETVDITAPAASTSGYAYAVVDCSPGDVFTLTGKGGALLKLWCFIDSSGNAIDPRAEDDLIAYDLAITAPATAAKLVVNTRFTTIPGSYLVKGRILKNEVADLRGNVADLQENIEYIPGPDLLENATWTDGNYINYAGGVSTSDNLRCSDYIPVTGGDRCVVFAKFVSGASTNVTTSIAAYNSSKVFLRRVGALTKNSGLAKISARLPADAAYVIISTGKTTYVEKATMYTHPSENWWPSRKWYALGDSITYGSVSTANGLTRDPFYAWPVIAATLLGYQLVNYAVPGMGFIQVAGMPPTGYPDNLPDVLAQSFTGAELVTVMLGTNDYGHDKTLGTIADTSATESVYGRIKLIVETMQTKCPTARIIFLTPIPRATAGSAATQYCKNAANGAGYTLDDVKDAIIESCEYYGIEYLNLQDTSPLNYANKASFLLDNLHPSQAGHKRLGEWIASKIVF